jgi:hypothetical protein
MKLNNLFDAVYYINLDSRTDRDNEFWRLNNNFLCKDTTIRISAFDAKNPNVSHGVLPLMRARAAHSVSYSKPFCHAIQNNFQKILILEDDAQPMIQDPEEMYTLVSNCQQTDYDILFLGGTIQSQLTKENQFLYSVKNNVLTTHAISFCNNNDLFKTIAPLGNNYNKTFDYLTRQRSFSATDLLTSELTLKYRSFFPNRLIYGQYESFSDIDGKNAAYNTDMIKRFEKYT